MSKAGQRYISVFSAGRESFIQTKKDYYRNKEAPIFMGFWEYQIKQKKAIYKTLNYRFRSIWAAGWAAARKGSTSGKVRKRAARIKLAKSNIKP